MNEREWIRIASQALQSLDRIEKTLSQPKDHSAWRVAANRRISKAMDYIAKLEMDLNDNPLTMEVWKTKPKVFLNDLRKILTEK